MKPLALALTLPSLALLTLPARADVLERVVVKVNGDIVTLSDFESRQVAAVQAARIGPGAIEAYLRDNNARILQEAIDDLLVVQRAGDLGIKLRPDYVKEVIEGIKKENNLASDSALQEQLRREGMSLDDLKRNIERSILKRQVLARELESKAGVSEADARAEYDAHLAEYTRPATIHLQEILVKPDSSSPSAAEIVARARAGEDFAALARAHSAAPTRDSGGDLGVLARGDLNPELEKVAFTLAAGAASDPIPTADGFRILRVAEKTEGGVVPFEQVKAQISERLAQQRWAKEYERYVEGLRKTAVIDIRVREVPLKVDLPATPSTFLEPPAAETRSAPAAAPRDDAEISTTPQQQPERVAPPTRPVKPEDKKPDDAPPPPPVS